MGGNANWKVVDGAITASEGDVGLLLTTSQFGNHAMKADCRLVEGGDSGIFLDTIAKPIR